MMQRLLSSVALSLSLHLVPAAKVYMCKWPRSVLSSGDPNLTVTVDGAEVRCDRTLDAHYLCEAACDYQHSDPDSCIGPVEDGDICNTVWGRTYLSYYKLESIDSTQACMRRYNSDCTMDMGGTFCYKLDLCYGSFQQVVVEKETFVARYGYEPSFLQQPWEILEPPSCGGYTEEQCCLMHTNYYRCLHGVPPMVYHRGLAAASQAWADEQNKDGNVHSPWGPDFYPSYTEVLTWGTSGCDRGVGSWYKEIGVHNFSIYEVQDAGGFYNSGHMVLLLWSNHTMVGCGFGGPGNAIIVCQYAWRHQGGKFDADWQANLFPRSGATQEECRTIGIESVNFPVLAAGEDISAEQVAALQAGTLTGDGSGWLDGGEPPMLSEATNTSTTSEATNTSTTSGTDTTSTATTTTTQSNTTSSGTVTTTTSTASNTSSETTTVTVTSTATNSSTSTETVPPLSTTTTGTMTTQTVTTVSSVTTATASGTTVTTATTGSVTTVTASVTTLTDTTTMTADTATATAAATDTSTSTGTTWSSSASSSASETSSTESTTATATTGTTATTVTTATTETTTTKEAPPVFLGSTTKTAGDAVNDGPTTSSTSVDRLSDSHTSSIAASWYLNAVLLLTAVAAW